MIPSTAKAQATASSGGEVRGAPLSYLAYRQYVITGRLAHGNALPLWLWPVPLIYVAVPTVAGSLTGKAKGRTT